VGCERLACVGHVERGEVRMLQSCRDKGYKNSTLTFVSDQDRDNETIDSNNTRHDHWDD